MVLFGQGISSFGDSITNTAMPLLVLALTGSGLAMGVVGVLTTLPDLIVGLPAGAYADRWDRRRMMFAADLGRCVLTALVPISVWLGGPTLVVIFAVTFPMNVLRVLWLAAYTAAVPGLVGRAEVPRANAIFEAVFNVGWIVGPALAGFLAATIGPGATIAIDAVTFLISAGAMLLVRRPLRAEGRSLETHILTDIREGIAYVARPAHPARVHRAVDDDVGDLDRPHDGHDLLHHDRPRAQLRGRRHGAVGVRAGGACSGRSPRRDSRSAPRAS